MSWRISAHVGFQREFSNLVVDDADRVRDALARITAQLDRIASVDPRRVFASGTLTPVPDLVPLAGTGIPGSYRLRVGKYRLSLALLPSEKLVLVTAIARRTDATYPKLPDLHRRRFNDR
ncbi:MAG: hypothetical protein HY556_04215 [Euryarchaeota archaeon]|nr:hypothetical protein [Euryarchaeota archaeon]